MRDRWRYAALAAAILAVAVPVVEGSGGSPAASAAASPTVTVAAAAPEDAGAEAERIVDGMSVRERAASVVMGHVAGTDRARLREYMADSGLGGFILMGGNVPGSEASLRALTHALTPDPDLPPLLAIDQEGGDVSRLPWDDLPSALTLKREDPAAARLAFAARAALVARGGMDVNFGVVADVAPDSSSFIHRRALGTSPRGTAARVAGAVEGEADAVLTTLKHFPGHGAAPGDSHVGIPRTSMSLERWRDTDGAPFAAGIQAGAPLLMFGHLAYTAVDAAPASLSVRWHEIAREDLGFEGVAITDDLGMLQASGLREYRDPVRNAVRALAAGNDMVLTVMFSHAATAPRIVDGIVAAVERGELAPERLREAAVRVTTLRVQSADRGSALLPCTGCDAARH